MIPAGNYRARARAVAAVDAFGESAKKGTKYIRLQMAIVEGEFSGEVVQWDGFFTDRTAKRTIESLRYCGVSGDDLTDLGGVDANVVDIVVEHERWTPTEGEKAGEEQTRARVAWINGGGGVPDTQKLDAGKLAAFAASMRGTMMSTKPIAAAAKTPVTPNRAAGAAGDDIPF